MRKLSGIIFVVCMACLFSVQAGAEENSVQLQKRQQYIPPPPQIRTTVQQTQNVNQLPVGWVTNSVQQVNVQYNQTPQQSGTSVGSGQDLKQFSDQTQKQMADFRKL